MDVNSFIFDTTIIERKTCCLSRKKRKHAKKKKRCFFFLSQSVFLPVFLAKYEPASALLPAVIYQLLFSCQLDTLEEETKNLHIHPVFIPSVHFDELGFQSIRTCSTRC